MNVIITNRFRDILKDLNIEIIKSMEGEFEVKEIIDTFSNFYFERMILDITALKDYKNVDNLQKLSISLDMSKVILLLDDDPEFESNTFLSKIISMGIYNFTRNLEGVKYLIEHPHEYKDVAHLHNVSEIVGEDNTGAVGRCKIIGVKNLTMHAGATSLTFMMKKCLSTAYSVCAMEVDKKDFVYLNDPELISTTTDNFAKELMKHSNVDVIVVDLNDYTDLSLCNDILFLIEPGTLNLNRLLKRDRRVFERYKDKKLVLNRSLLNGEDLVNFEYEANTKVFYNIPPIDERNEDFYEVNRMLAKLGFTKCYEGDGDNTPSETSDSGGGIVGKITGMFGF